MKRFVFVSFAFLAWAFYELSGGADFQPRVAETQPVSQTGTARTKATPPAKVRTVKASTLVASPAIAPAIALADAARVETAQVRESVASPEPATLPVATASGTGPDLETVANLDQIRNSLSQGLSLFPDSAPIAQPLMLASLEQGAAGLKTAPVVATGDTTTTKPAEWTPAPADIREITGTRVNMRDGPGTIYPVISRLTIGHEVEVLSDSGTGWLRLRTMPEHQIGWISSSLVSKTRP